MEWNAKRKAGRQPAGACEAHVEETRSDRHCSWECPTASGHMAMGLGADNHALFEPAPAPALPCCATCVPYELCLALACHSIIVLNSLLNLSIMV